MMFLKPYPPGCMSPSGMSMRVAMNAWCRRISQTCSTGDATEPVQLNLRRAIPTASRLSAINAGMDGSGTWLSRPEREPYLR